MFWLTFIIVSIQQVTVLTTVDPTEISDDLSDFVDTVRFVPIRLSREFSVTWWIEIVEFSFLKDEAVDHVVRIPPPTDYRALVIDADRVDHRRVGSINDCKCFAAKNITAEFRISCSAISADDLTSVVDGVAKGVRRVGCVNTGEHSLSKGEAVSLAIMADIRAHDGSTIVDADRSTLDGDAPRRIYS